MEEWGEKDGCIGSCMDVKVAVWRFSSRFCINLRNLANGVLVVEFRKKSNRVSACLFVRGS
jgi:hypothetical protein